MKRLALTLIVALAACTTLTSDASASDRTRGHGRSSVGHTLGHLIFGGHGYGQSYYRPSYGHYDHRYPSYSHRSYGHSPRHSYGHGSSYYGHRGGHYGGHGWSSYGHHRSHH